MITCSIVTYHNDHDELKKAMDSFLNTELEVKLYISDNSSNNDIKELCSDKRIEYIYNNSNPGFGSGHNIAIRRAINDGSDYHLVLNPDIYFDKGVIENIYNFMSGNSTIGLLMPKVIYPDGEMQYLCKLLPTPLDWFIRRILPLRFIKNQIDYIFEMRFTDYNRIMEVPFLSGCFMFFNLKALKEIGLFDENIFMYCEDIDITRRVFASQYKSIYYPYVTIIHNHKGGSKTSKKLLFEAIKSSIYYFNKWGWFFDNERIIINKKITGQYK